MLIKWSSRNVMIDSNWYEWTVQNIYVRGHVLLMSITPNHFNIYIRTVKTIKKLVKIKWLNIKWILVVTSQLLFSIVCATLCCVGFTPVDLFPFYYSKVKRKSKLVHFFMSQKLNLALNQIYFWKVDYKKSYELHPTSRKVYRTRCELICLPAHIYCILILRAYDLIQFV